MAPPEPPPTIGSLIRGAARSALLAGVLLVPCRAPAQPESYRIDAGAQVSSIELSFTGTRSFPEAVLRAAIQTTEQGSNVGLRTTFSFLPLVTPVGEHPFSPVRLQEDVARLRGFYHESGFAEASIDYQLAYDRGRNIVGITFIIHEGDPSLLRSTTILGPDSTAFVADPGLAVEWAELLADELPPTAKRPDRDVIAALPGRLTAWLNDHGYPSAAVRAVLSADTASDALDLEVRVDPGERQRISSIRVTGQSLVDSAVVLREIPLGPGDWYSASALQEGRREVLSLGIFRQARFTTDSTRTGPEGMALVAELTEGELRTVTGDLGYDSRGGITAQAQWQHRNFPGSARRFTVSALAQTGLLSFQDIPEILYRTSLAFQEPYVFGPKSSLVIEPFAEYRDDQRDKSTALGASVSMIWQYSPLATVTLRYIFSGRTVDEYRYGDYSSGKADLLSILGQTLLGGYVETSTLALLPVYGILDDLINPTEGFGLRPDIRVTVPSPLNSVEYARLDIVARGYLPLGPSVGLMGRVSAGSLFPFGKSRVTAETDTLTNYLQLRDAAFVAGGPEDVRGWESRLLGPKIPDVRLSTVNGDTVLSADAYIPVAGAIRVSFSLELRLPFPGLGPSWGTMLFLDGGRVWSPTRSSFAFASPGQEEVYYAVGGGVDFRTPVGALRMSMGYKLNPSELDLRSASDVFKASQTGTPLDQVPTKQSLRWQFNLSLAVAF